MYLLWESFLKISEVSHIFGQPFSKIKVSHYFLQKCFGQGFGRYFLQSHLVTLVAGPTLALVGGPNSYSGNVYARNPTTGYYGPVCDDNFDISDVITYVTLLLSPSTYSKEDNSSTYLFTYHLTKLYLHCHQKLRKVNKSLYFFCCVSWLIAKQHKLCILVSFSSPQ
jgi:hypothetical protein